MKTNLERKRFMIIQEVDIEEGVEEEVVTKTKVSIKEIGIKIGVQIKIIKIETKIEMSIKITKDKDTKTKDGKITTQINGALKIITTTTDNLKDMTTTTTTTEDNKKVNKKLMKSKETITWEKWEVKLQAMMMMLIIERQFIDLNKFNSFFF